MKTVGDLKKYLEKNKLSPEQAGDRAKISNMTIRRLIKKSSNLKLPEKYRVQLSQLELPNLENIGDVIEYLEQSTSDFNDSEMDEMRADCDEKVKKAPVDQGFKDKIKELLHIAFSSKHLKSKAIAIGALLYFLNPIDLIPDFYGPIGYVDDLGVITMALVSIAKSKQEKVDKLQKSEQA